MGQKVPPPALRLGINRDSDSIWYSERDFPRLVLEDFQIRSFLRKRLERRAISRIQIKRKANQVEINICSGKPGLIIGRGGAEINLLREEVSKLIGKLAQVNVIEERNPSLCALIVAETVAAQLEKRVSYRRAMKQAASRVMRAGSLGVKICVSGRLAGTEIARCEWYKEGKVPLGTFRSDIDYGFTEAMTLYGKIGVKVWIYKGDILRKKPEEAVEIEEEI